MQKTEAKIKLALQGPSGSGKTFSSILLAKGLTNDLSKVCLLIQKMVVQTFSSPWRF